MQSICHFTSANVARWDNKNIFSCFLSIHGECLSWNYFHSNWTSITGVLLSDGNQNTVLLCCTRISWEIYILSICCRAYHQLKLPTVQYQLELFDKKTYANSPSLLRLFVIYILSSVHRRLTRAACRCNCWREAEFSRGYKGASRVQTLPACCRID